MTLASLPLATPRAGEHRTRVDTRVSLLSFKCTAISAYTHTLRTSLSWSAYDRKFQSYAVEHSSLHGTHPSLNDHGRNEDGVQRPWRMCCHSYTRGCSWTMVLQHHESLRGTSCASKVSASKLSRSRNETRWDNGEHGWNFRFNIDAYQRRFVGIHKSA